MESDSYLLRLVSRNDKFDLLKVYSDKIAVPFFNSDNCSGDIFYYETEKRMGEAIDFWINEYNQHKFVRWAIIDKKTNAAIGTIELFNRESNDYFTNCGLLRLDLRSDYETAVEIEKILKIIIENTYSLFHCDKIATKAIASAKELIKVLENQGFKYSEEKLIGHDGTCYDSYFILHR